MKGSDLCELLGLFFDLAETSNISLHTQLEELQKYKTAYQNKIKKERNAVKKQDLTLLNAELQRQNNQLRKEIAELKSLNRHHKSTIELQDLDDNPIHLEKHRKSA